MEGEGAGWGGRVTEGVVCAWENPDFYFACGVLDVHFKEWSEKTINYGVKEEFKSKCHCLLPHCVGDSSSLTGLIP